MSVRRLTVLGFAIILSVGIAHAQLLPRQSGVETDTPKPQPHSAPAPSAPSFSVAGSWNSNWGQMELSGKTNVSGSYTYLGGGTLSGVLEGRHFDGYWSQSRSVKQCAVAQFGTRYWGRISLQFAADGRSFSGIWSYCDGPLGGDWSGTR